jgi:cation-transporting P-type ATPase E
MGADNSACANTSRSGLTEAEVTQRRSQGLANKVSPPTGRTYVQIFRENIFTFINTVIFVLGAALVMVGRLSDALISLALISTNIFVSVVQEIRAKLTHDRIAVLTRPAALVVCDAVPHNVPPEELVIGDVLQVNLSDLIALDGRVIGEGQMQLDESHS